jgi:hypothetical protein
MKGLFGPSRIMSTDEVLTVCREGTVLYVDGKPVKQSGPQFQIQGNVQPMTGLELLRVPELDRHLERLWVYTNEKTRPLQLNDRIIRCGINYQVERFETWGHGPYGYQKAQIVKIDVGPASVNQTP